MSLTVKSLFKKICLVKNKLRYSLGSNVEIAWQCCPECLSVYCACFQLPAVISSQQVMQEWTRSSTGSDAADANVVTILSQGGFICQ